MIDRACISLNSLCNFNCKYCHFAKKRLELKDENKSITKDIANKIANNIVKYVDINGIDEFKLGIVGAGEPLLSFDELRIIVESLLQSEGASVYKIYTITNGALVNKEVLDFAYKYKGQFVLSFSLDGYKEINDKYRMCFDLVWENIKLYEAKFGMMPQINTTITSDSILNQEKLFEFFRKEKISNVNFSKVFGEIDNSMRVSDIQYEEFLLNAKRQKLMSRQNNKSLKYDCAKYGRLCGVGRTNIYITSQGIYPCSRFWNNPIFRLGDCTSSLTNIESILKTYTPCPDHQCYFEYNKGEKV